jgi:hypothetical protein
MSPEQITEVCCIVIRAYQIAVSGSNAADYVKDPVEHEERLGAISKANMLLSVRSILADPSKQYVIPEDAMLREIVLALADGI